ncbi:MAG: class I SAM-dependent methyltransferase, partial [Chitinophagaceae bacterium]
MSNINDTYFEGTYKEIWRTIIPEELTSKEVDFMSSYFNLGKDSKVLDLMCGYGRHAVALAQKGMIITGIDNLKDYIEEIKEVAKNENLSIDAILGDVI